MAKKKASKRIKETLNGHPPIKVDFGCGPNKRKPQPGEDQAPWLGVDTQQFDGVDMVLNAGVEKFPWADNSVEEAHASHFVEHLEAAERVHFINELYRVLKPGGKFTMIVPHWASCRAYGDLTHKWPPVSEFWFYYLDKNWRKVNAPHSEYQAEVDFAITWGYSKNPKLDGRSNEYVQNAFEFYKEAIMDIIATFVKK